MKSDKEFILAQLKHMKLKFTASISHKHSYKRRIEKIDKVIKFVENEL